MLPKVSVVVPVYNVEKYIGLCLQSLVSQSLKEIEIVVINDGSKDGSQYIIEKYARDYPGKIHCYEKPNSGVSDTRNFGLERATGEYIGFMDGDDWADADMYRLLYEKSHESGADIAVCGFYKALEDGKLKAQHLGDMHLYGSTFMENPELMHAGAPFVWNKLYRAEFLKRSGIRFPAGMVFEDVYFNYTLYLHAACIVKVNRPLYYYRLRQEGAFNAGFNTKALQIFQSLGMVNEHYINEGKFEVFRSELLRVNLSHINWRLKSFFLSGDYALKRLFASERQRHLDRYFPEWRKVNAYPEKAARNKRLQAEFWASPGLVKLYALVSLPPLLPAFQKVFRGLKGFLILCRKPRILAAKCLSFCRCAVYAWHRQKSIIENTMLVEMRHGRTIGCCPFYMLREVAANTGYQCFVSSLAEKKHRDFLAANGIVFSIMLFCRCHA